MKAILLPDDWQMRVILLLAVPGMILAYFLLLYHNGDLIEVCRPNGWEDCGKVSGPDGTYSSIGPIPVALIGLVGYALIFLLIWLKDWLPRLDDYIPELMIGLTGMGLLFSFGLTILEIFVIQAICRFCILSALIIMVMFILSISYLRKVTGVQNE